MRPSPLPSSGLLVVGLLVLAPAPATAPASAPRSGPRPRRPDKARAEARPVRGLQAQLLPLHGLPGLPRRRDGQRRLRPGERQDVLADVLRPQLHQLRGVPDGPQRDAERAARGRAAATRRTGAPRCPSITDDTPRSVRSPGGRPTTARPAPPATSRTSSRSSPPTRSSSPRTAGAVTSPGPWSPGAAATGRAASSTSTTSRSPTPRRRSSPASPRSAPQLTATPGSWKPDDGHGRLPVVRRRRADPQGHATATLQLTRARLGPADHGPHHRVPARLPDPVRHLGAHRAGAARRSCATPPRRSSPASPRSTRRCTSTPAPGTPSPTLDVQWYADGQPIADATGTTLDLGPDLVSRVITAEVTATPPGLRPGRASRPRRPRRSPRAPSRSRPRPACSAPRARRDAHRRPGRLPPADADVAIEWLRDGVRRRRPARRTRSPTSTSAPGSRPGSR